MTDPDRATALDELTDLPLQPTGSGVADLEIAYEQMKLAEEAEAGASPGGTAARAIDDQDDDLDIDPRAT